MTSVVVSSCMRWRNNQRRLYSELLSRVAHIWALGPGVTWWRVRERAVLRHILCTSHGIGSGSIPGRVRLAWAVSNGDRFFGLPLSVPFCHCFILIHLPPTLYNRRNWLHVWLVPVFRSDESTQHSDSVSGRSLSIVRLMPSSSRRSPSFIVPYQSAACTFRVTW